MKLRNIIILNVLIIIVGFVVAVAGSYYWEEREVMQDEKRRIESYHKILDAASVSPIRLTVNFNKPISVGSPLIFGGAHAPLLSHVDAWNKIGEAGVTIIRRDFFMEQILPTNITLEDYKNNKNNIQDPSNWNQDMINNLRNRYRQAHNRGIKTMGIVDYAPSWLTYSGTPYGYPKDFDVYEDLVKKLYTIFRDDLDYLEIWNEPTFSHFNDITNSNKTMEQNYIDLAKHTIRAVRDVDVKKNDGKIIPLGGLVADNPKYAGGMLEKILREPDIIKNLSFISYHSYGYEEPSNTLYREILKKNGFPNMPLFLTEWNYSSSEQIEDPHKIGNEAITYTANQLLNFIKEGLAGANYYMLEPVGFNSPEIGIKYMGFYRWENGQATLLPQARTWRILSNQMGLGKGESKIYEVVQESGTEKDANLAGVLNDWLEPETFNTIGFRNVDGQYGVAIVNDKSSAQLAEVNLEKTTFKRFVKVQVYYASSGNEAKVPVYEGELIAKNGEINFAFYIPQESVVGMIFTAEKEWYDILRLPTTF